MAVLIIAVLVWAILAGFILVVLCMNSSRLSRIEEPFKDYSLKARPVTSELSQAQNPLLNLSTSGD